MSVIVTRCGNQHATFNATVLPVYACESMFTCDSLQGRKGSINSFILGSIFLLENQPVSWDEYQTDHSLQRNIGSLLCTTQTAVF